jgi:hypothetical protein
VAAISRQQKSASQQRRRHSPREALKVLLTSASLEHDALHNDTDSKIARTVVTKTANSADSQPRERAPGVD